MSAGSNSFWNHVTSLIAGLLARADDVNAHLDGIAEGFDSVETELDKCIQVTGAGMTTFDISSNAATRANKIVGFDATGALVELKTDESAAAQAWATTTGALVEATDYSAKEWAIGTFVPSGSAKEWAITAEDTEVITGQYSALHWAAKAAASAAAATLPASVGTAGQMLKVNAGATAHDYASFTDAQVVTLAGAQTLTNKTITSPTLDGTPTIDLSGIASSGDLPVAQGGTGASTAAAARDSLGVQLGNGALVERSTDQTSIEFPDKIEWNSEVYDTDSIHDNSTNPSRLTVPSGVSKVRLSASIFGVGVTGYRLYKNGSMLTAGGATYFEAGAASPSSGASPILSVSPGDYFELGAATGSGGTVHGTSSSRSWFQMEIIL